MSENQSIPYCFGCLLVCSMYCKEISDSSCMPLVSSLLNLKSMIDIGCVFETVLSNWVVSVSVKELV